MTAQWTTSSTPSSLVHVVAHVDLLEDHVGAFHDLLDALDLLRARVDVLEDHGDVLDDVLDTLVHVPTCLPPATDHGRRRRLADADFAPYLRRCPPSRC